MIDRAGEITGLKLEQLRSRAATWRGIPKPPIRVTKSDTNNHLSRWLFAEEDCWAYARREGVAEPRPAPPPSGDPGDPDTIADAILARLAKAPLSSDAAEELNKALRSPVQRR